jgi:hypothetical protein
VDDEELIEAGEERRAELEGLYTEESPTAPEFMTEQGRWNAARSSDDERSSRALIIPADEGELTPVCNAYSR